MQKHKLLSFLLALLAAIVLWVYAVTVVNPDDVASIRGVKVRIVGTNELQMNHLILTGGEVQYVDVEIAGRRSDLKELNNTTLEAVADVSKIDGPGTYELSWSLDPPSTVASGDIKLTGSSANKIKVKVSEYQQRPEIPVQIEYRGALAEGFVRDPAVMNMDTVSVSGPAEEVEKIQYARVTVDLDDTKESLDQELEYELMDEDGQVLAMSSYVTIEDPTIRVMVPVYCYKQIKLELALIPGGGAKEEHAVYTIDPPSIGVIGDEKALKAMPSTLVIKEIKLADVKDSLQLTLTPELPAGVSNRAEEDSVRISLKLEGLSTRTIHIPSEQIRRDNDDVKLDFAASRIPITIRGTTQQVNSLNISKIHVTADMVNDYDPTTMTVRLNITLEDGLDCGVIGTYSVPVVETPEETEPDETTSDR